MPKTKANFTPDEIVAAGNGYWINGIEAQQGFGFWLSKNKGDINGDGYDDLLVRATYYGSSLEKFYVLFGDKGGFVRDLANLNGDNGFSIIIKIR